MLKKIIAVLIFTVIITVGYIGIQNGLIPLSTPNENQNQNQNQNQNNSQDQNDAVDPIKQLLEQMTLEEKIGQLVIAGIDAYDLNANAEQLIKDYHVGGFILLKKNIRSTEQLSNLINDLKATNHSSKIPLFFAVDEEGGRITRLPAEIKKFPDNERLGQINDPVLAYQIGKAIGRQLKAFGFNLNFAPVLDVNNNPDNVVIGDRSFGSDPQLVAQLGIQTMKGLQSQNIISAVKHFPGHGDTSVDSHVSLPTIEHSVERLRALELIPFKAAIDNQADMVMLAHILLPQIDPEHPASFSPAIISDLLRQELGFQGVVITDDLTMGAIVNQYDIGKVAVASIRAGSDIVLVCHDYEKEKKVLQALIRAAELGELPMARIDESVYRILRLKHNYQLSDQVVQMVDIESLNREVEEIYQKYPALSP